MLWSITFCGKFEGALFGKGPISTGRELLLCIDVRLSCWAMKYGMGARAHGIRNFWSPPWFSSILPCSAQDTSFYFLLWFSWLRAKRKILIVLLKTLKHSLHFYFISFFWCIHPSPSSGRSSYVDKECTNFISSIISANLQSSVN